MSSCVEAAQNVCDLGEHVSTLECDVKLNKTKYALMASANALSSAALHAVRFALGRHSHVDSSRITGKPDVIRLG